MATTLASGLPHQDSLSGSPEKRLDVAPDGTLWALLVDTGRAKFFSSTNGGNTWAVSAGSDLSFGSGQDTAVPSFFIDADGYAHVSFVQWQRDPQTVIYARGTPRTGGGWSWSTKTISPAGGRLNVDSDIIAFRSGSGWVAWVGWSYGTGASGARVTKLDITASGSITIASTTHGPLSGFENYQTNSLEFVSTGDGKTPAAAPHLFYFVGSMIGGNVYWHKATYSSGNWTWTTPITVETGTTIYQSVVATVHDGTRHFAVWSTSGTALKGAEWDGVAGSATTRTPPAMPGGTGNILGISLACDPSTSDIYLVAYGSTNGNIIYCKFTRATTSWGAWTTAVTRSTYSEDGDVQLVRHPPRDSVDLIWSEGSTPNHTIKYQQLLALTRSPTAPTLVSPPNGARQDLAAGATFKWTYNPVSPGDTQQSWAFRRQFGAGPTVQYWNVGTQAWQSGEVFNATNADTPTQVSFPSGQWTTGTTYSWSVRTKSSTGANSSYATDRTITASLAPTVAVTSPTGIAYGTSTPLVTWTYTSATPQRDYEVRIVPTLGVTIDPNDPGPSTWTSGVVTSSVGRSVRVGTALSDGTAYRAYVRSTDTNSVASVWSYSDFTISITPPSGPLIEVYDTLPWETEVPRMHLVIQARSNFLSANQAIGQSAWDVLANCTLFAQIDDPANQLIASLKMVSSAAGDLSAITSVGSPPPAPIGQPANTRPLSFPVKAGLAYTATASFKTAGTVRAARVKIQWYDDDDGTGVLISESSGNQVATGTTSYAQAYCTDVAPDGAVLARMVVEVLATTAGSETFYVSRLSLHPGRDTAWQSGGYSSTQTVQVERSDDGGETWSTVLSRVKPDLYQIAEADDRLLPYNVEVQYRARTNADVGGDSILTSDYSPTSIVSVESNLWGIRDEDDDLAEFNAYVVDYQTSDEDASTVHRPAGRFTPVVDTEGLQSATGSLKLYVPSNAIDSVCDVITRIVPLTLQSPAGGVSRVRFLQRDYAVEARVNRVITVNFVAVE